MTGVAAVRRLVEQNHVGRAEQRAGQKHLDLFGLVQRAHRVVHVAAVEAEALHQLRGLGFGLPAVQLGELGLELGGAVAVLLAEVGLGVQRLLLLGDLEKARVALHDRVEDCLALIGEVVLLEHRHTVLRVERDVALRGLEVAGEDAKERGLARAVRADDAVAVARQELQVDVRKEVLAVEIDGHTGNIQHDDKTFLY